MFPIYARTSLYFSVHPILVHTGRPTPSFELDREIQQTFLLALSRIEPSLVKIFQFHLETTPNSLKGLIENCGHEIVPGPYVQKPEIMLADENRFSQINRSMVEWLEGLAKKWI